ncbi:MAG TPA: hypothetical protein VNV43_10285 [Candidatus Acidoferrales bacterium]|jgi:hypothetical protein|nr:hypothetical protein [Candidatus Acidoferrales bacterium]
MLTKFAILAAVGCSLAVTARAETIITNEFWICASTNTLNLGTLANPFDGSDQAKFDTVMSNMPPNCAIHILAGAYETWGQINWGVKTGQKIIGSGIDVTVLRFATNVPTVANGPTIIASDGSPVTNVEVSDLTVDCNYAGQTESYHGIGLDGTQNSVRRVKVENLGYYPDSNMETWGIDLVNSYLPYSAGNIIEECEVDPIAGGHNVTAISLDAGVNTFISGAVRNNRVFLTPDPNGAQIAFNCSWATDCQVEDNYVDGADSGFATDTGGSTNMIFAHNIFKDVYAGFVFWAYHRQNLTFAFNKISLCPTNSNFSAAFGFPDGTTHTNIMIIGNDVGWDGTPSRSAYALYVTNIVGMTLADNSVDSNLNNYISASGLNMYNNYDLYGNTLPELNNLSVGGTPVTSLGLALISSTEISSALTNLGLPGNPAAIVTNSETGVNLSGTFIGNGYLGGTFSGTLIGNGSGLTGLNASQLTSGTVPLAQLPSIVLGNSGTLTYANPNLGAVLSISNALSPQPVLKLNLYTGTDYISKAFSAGYIDLNQPNTRLFLGSPSKPITRLNMQNVQIGEDFPSMIINTQAYYLTPTNRSWAFVSSGQGQKFLALIANSALGYITGQQSTDPGAGHRSLAFMTFSDTNDVYHHTAQYVFDTYNSPASWFSNQVYWSWRIRGAQVADIDTNASWHLNAPLFSVSGNIVGGSFKGNGNALTNIQANSIVGGLTTNITVFGAASNIEILCFTNGILSAVR